MSSFLKVNYSKFDGTNEEFDDGIIKLLLIANDFLIFVVFSIMGVFGCLSNILNFIIFFQQGRRECITLCLFALGISDFCCCCTLLVFSLLYSYNFVNNYTIIDPVALDVMVIYPAGMFYDISEGITAFISLQRCLCVAMPIRFKNVFTVKLSFIFIFVIYALTIAAFTPHFKTCGVYIKFDKSTNRSITALWTTTDRAEVLSYLNYIVHVGLDAIYQIIIVVSAAVMITGLIQSAKFCQQEMKQSNVQRSSEPIIRLIQSSKCRRQAIKQPKVRSSSGCSPPVNTGYLTHSTTNKQAQTTITGKPPNLLNKNVNVVKTILALTILAIACNSERLCAMYGMSLVPGLNADPKAESVFLIILHLTFLVNMINASMNVLVYYNFNPSYRRTFWKIFCRRSPSEIAVS